LVGWLSRLSCSASFLISPFFLAVQKKSRIVPIFSRKMQSDFFESTTSKKWIFVDATKNQKIVHSIRKIGLVSLDQMFNFCRFKIIFIAKNNL
jgi:hypothetical protein